MLKVLLILDFIDRNECIPMYIIDVVHGRWLYHGCIRLCIHD